ncbi:SDR family NAD(P)-dependent oxidoreductase [Mycobacterium sp. URHB0021]
MDTFAGKVAVVTGGGSGIGQALATELARRGAKLAISDVDSDGLARTGAAAAQRGRTGQSRLPGRERAESVLAYADSVKTRFGTVHQSDHIAGIAFMGDIEVTAFKDLGWVMDVNFWGVVNCTKAFLPHLIASGDGHLVNMSSMYGLFAVQGQAAYNSAKFAVRGFTEAIRQEMVSAGHPVKVTCVHPGYIKTPLIQHRPGPRDSIGLR